MNDIGQQIRLARITRGYTQSELAGLLGISPSAVGMYEQNKRKPSADMICLICETFRVSADELLGVRTAAADVYDLIDTVKRSLQSKAGLNCNGIPLGVEDTQKFLEAMMIVTNILMNEKMSKKDAEAAVEAVD